VVVVVVVAVVLGSKSSGPSVALTGDGYSNGNLSNTRATGGPIDQATVRKLHVAWTLPLSAKATYGADASTPVIAKGVVYQQDLASNVRAVDLKTGKVLWSKEFNSEDNGPNGIVVAEGRVFGATATAAFALDQSTGQQLWSVGLPRNEHESIDMAPGYHDGNVYVSTVPAQLSENNGGGIGVLWALDAKTGRKLWHFDTAPENLWSPAFASINAGGGVWYSPAFDAHGGMYVGTANPVPLPGTEEQPWGASRPGPDLYTDSLVKLDPATGKLRWYYQATPHDLYDWDFQDPPILARVGGRQVVLGAGKSGVVAALDANSGKLLWRRDVGTHNGHDNDGLYAMRHEYSKLNLPETVYPGELGGVIAPMASNGSTVFAPVVNLPATFSAQSGHPNEGPEESGELVALDVATGKVKWTHQFSAPAFGAATVVNDLVFVATVDGKLYAFNSGTGAIVWESELPAGTISGPAVEGNTLVIGAGKPSESQEAALVAYRLGG
jgi:outer membrane protein assembly factor BamB